MKNDKWEKLAEKFGRDEEVIDEETTHFYDLGIEQRAELLYPNHSVLFGDERHQQRYNGYIRGANDQLKIDIKDMVSIETVCKWLRDNFYHEETMCDSVAYLHESCDVDVMIDDFRKAMKERNENIQQ